MFQNALASLQTNPLLAVLVLLIVVLACLVLWLSYRVNGLLKGAQGGSLESAIRTLIAKVERLESHALKTNDALKDVNRRVMRSVQAVSVKRFDPFGGAGGQQSFSTALLDEKGDGAVISGIHARDGVRVYAKEVKNFSSERELSEDEANAIAEAKRRLG